MSDLRNMSYKIALYGMMIINTLVIVFHILVICGIIPYDMVWGGRLESRSQMLRLELISLLTNLLMMIIFGIEAEMLLRRANRQAMRAIFWMLTVLFIVNSIGNIFSKNNLELIIFAPLTIISALFCMRLALGKNK